MECHRWCYHRLISVNPSGYGSGPGAARSVVLPWASTWCLLGHVEVGGRRGGVRKSTGGPTVRGGAPAGKLPAPGGGSACPRPASLLDAGAIWMQPGGVVAVLLNHRPHGGNPRGSGAKHCWLVLGPRVVGTELPNVGARFGGVIIPCQFAVGEPDCAPEQLRHQHDDYQDIR